MNKVPFNRPPLVGNEEKYISQALCSGKLSGDGFFGKKCQDWFERSLGCERALLTPSCTHALEMAAILVDIKEGDEVIMPSYTFVSTANAFVLRGAKVVFVDIEPKTMNMDASLVESAITSRTKVIVPVHYAGMSCDMDLIMDIASRYDLFVIEDAAQAMMSTYRGRPLGTFGHMAAFSFHETKNYTSGGEGGLIIINDQKYVSRAEIIREKGTNRSLFFRGMVDKYSWVDVGSSYLPSEIQAAYLFAQLEKAEIVNNNRMETWEYYLAALKPLALKKYLVLPTVPINVKHNAHMFYLKVENLSLRTEFIDFLKEREIGSVFHYIPLHSSPAGEMFGVFSGLDRHTTVESEKLVRLPIWFGMTTKDCDYVIGAVEEFFN